MPDKAVFPASKPIPVTVQKRYKIIGCTGGPLHDAMPIRSNGKNSGDLLWMIPNGTVVVAVDTSKDLALIKPYYDVGDQWGMIQMEDAGLFTASPTGQNWIEYKGHLEALDDTTPEPEPTYTLVEMELYSIKIEFEPKFRVSVIFKQPDLRRLQKDIKESK